MLCQLHWRNRAIDKYHETQFVAQANNNDFTDANALFVYFRSIIRSRETECPEGWGPMICDEAYPQFVRTADASIIIPLRESL